ncbi:hypothetical protein NEOLEDRAFT_1179686 [Neolentinus lepideus HHB14362 ss-1]|uniref:Uncharacterized protein n=1 Tax=Neolentinus lepideus HHB14362 ss-1 TaxID=1314782 RepID=A0A165RKD2_9AGAM|nr:hypothetical protein NEOLEDRAFT_1179686 [Neolentinus lepideus HHB14362 ss-1]
MEMEGEVSIQEAQEAQEALVVWVVETREDQEAQEAREDQEAQEAWEDQEDLIPMEGMEVPIPQVDPHPTTHCLGQEVEVEVVTHLLAVVISLSMMMTSGKALPPLPQEDVIEFENWLHHVLDEFDLMGIGQAQYDVYQVNFLPSYLKEEPSTWFQSTIQGVDSAPQVWTFTAVVITLFKRFLYTSMPKEANNKFEAIKYTTDSIKKMCDELEFWASHRVEPPSDYDFSHAIFNHLPECMRFECGVRHQAMPESHTIEGLVQILIGIE